MDLGCTRNRFERCLCNIKLLHYTNIHSGYPSLIFTDPEVAANLAESDTRDSMTERPQILNYMETIAKTAHLNGPNAFVSQS